MKVTAGALSPSAIEGAEPIYERLDLASAALENLARQTGLAEEIFVSGEGWAARVDVGGTEVWLRAEEGRWSIFAPPGSDESEVALAARRLHGLLGEQGDGWDLDR